MLVMQLAAIACVVHNILLVMLVILMMMVINDKQGINMFFLLRVKALAFQAIVVVGRFSKQGKAILEI